LATSVISDDEIRSAIDLLAELRADNGAIPKGYKLELELEVLRDGELTDHIVAMEYMDFENSKSLSGTFRVLKFRVY
jgi:hypothetical protein